MRIRFEAELYEWAARRNWFFVDVPAEPSADIAELPRMPRGFGAVKVKVSVGTTSWSTSIFPSGDHYVLPVKHAVLKAEQIAEGDTVDVHLDVLDA